MGDREPALLAEFLTAAEYLGAPRAAEPAPELPQQQNSTPEERLAFFGLL